MNLVIVTGLSGSGKTVALHALEDIGYFCIDNLPVGLMGALTDNLLAHDRLHRDRIALGIDARNAADDLAGLPAALQLLRDHGMAVKTLFLEADEPTLLQRFGETRRRHPLADGKRSLPQAIGHERDLLAFFRDSADIILDTSRTNLHELRTLTQERIAHTRNGLSLAFQSFGFKFGVPRDADLVFDARCLPNPHWHQHLRPLTGRDAAVQEFLREDERTERMFRHIADFVAAWQPCFEQEGRSFLTVSIGCTGGQHRSVYLVERLADHFSAGGQRPLVTHREMA